MKKSIIILITLLALAGEGWGGNIVNKWQDFSLFDYYTSSSQNMNIALSDYTGTNSVSLQTNGWYFPSGM